MSDQPNQNNTTANPDSREHPSDNPTDQTTPPTTQDPPKLSKRTLLPTSLDGTSLHPNPPKDPNEKDHDEKSQDEKDHDEKNPNRVPFPTTKTKFGVIQREIERLGLPSMTYNKEEGLGVKDEADFRDIGISEAARVRVVVNTTESVLGADARVSASLSAFYTEADQGHLHLDSAFIDVQASARAGIGISGTGATASISANIARADIGPVSAQLGISTSTGAFISPIQFSAHLLGTGVDLGERTGVSILGTGISVDIGKAIELTANHFIHHDPHAHVKPQVEKVKHEVEHTLKVDKLKLCGNERIAKAEGFVDGEINTLGKSLTEHHILNSSHEEGKTMPVESDGKSLPSSTGIAVDLKDSAAHN